MYSLLKKYKPYLTKQQYRTIKGQIKAANVNSNSQLYKQAGNSIVVNVLEAIFKQML